MLCRFTLQYTSTFVLRGVISAADAEDVHDHSRVVVSSLRHRAGVNIPRTQVGYTINTYLVFIIYGYTKQTRPFLPVRRVGSARLACMLLCITVEEHATEEETKGQFGATSSIELEFLLFER